MEFTHKTHVSKGRSTTEILQPVSPFKRHKAHRNVAWYLIVLGRIFTARRKLIRGLASDTYLRAHSLLELKTLYRETNYG